MSAGRNTATRDRHRAIIRHRVEPCGICRGLIDYDLSHLDPMSFVVDHVIPLARGGLDVIENKQAAHRRCNESKGARGAVASIPREPFVSIRSWNPRGVTPSAPGVPPPA